MHVAHDGGHIAAHLGIYNQWEKDEQHYSALIGLAAPLACLVVFGSSSFLLPSMGCILILLLALRKPIEKAEGTEAEKSGEEVGA